MSALAPAPARQLTEIGPDCSALARGAAILGTGGGGDPYIGRLLAEAAVRAHGPVPVVAVDDLPDDAVVLNVAMIGAPTVMVEKLPSAGQFAEAIRSLATHLGVTPTHIACIEVGGVNSTSPSASSRRSASRTGVRLTPTVVAISCSVRRAPAR